MKCERLPEKPRTPNPASISSDLPKPMTSWLAETAPEHRIQNPAQTTARNNRLPSADPRALLALHQQGLSLGEIRERMRLPNLARVRYWLYRGQYFDHAKSRLRYAPTDVLTLRDAGLLPPQLANALAANGLNQLEDMAAYGDVAVQRLPVAGGCAIANDCDRVGKGMTQTLAQLLAERGISFASDRFAAP